MNSYGTLKIFYDHFRDSFFGFGVFSIEFKEVELVHEYQNKLYAENKNSKNHFFLIAQVSVHTEHDLINTYIQR